MAVTVSCMAVVILLKEKTIVEIILGPKDFNEIALKKPGSADQSKVQPGQLLQKSKDLERNIHIAHAIYTDIFQRFSITR